MNYVLIDLNSDSRCKSHINFFYFFFSSRRRHTRWNCDWSSDVWSSDLVRSAPYTVDFRVRRPEESHAAPGRGVPPHHAVVDRASGLERLRRRVPDSARRVPLESEDGGIRGHRRHPVGGLHALDVPAGELRPVDEREERAPRRSPAARVVRDRADYRDGDSDGRVAEHLSQADGAVDPADAESGAARCGSLAAGGQAMIASLNAIVPMACVAAAGIAAMIAEAFTAPGERMPIAPLGIIGLVGAALAVGALWDHNATSFGVVAADNFGLFVTGILVVVGLLSLAISAPAIDRESLPRGEYYALMLFSTAGMILMATATDLLVIFLALEVLSIGVYVLTGIRRDSAVATEAAFKYFLLGAFASAFFLYGIAFTYGVTGSTRLDRVGSVIAAQALSTTPMHWLALGLLLVGFAFKVSAVPFHMWTPDAYEGAPSSVTGFMSTGVKAAAFAAFVRVFLSAFEPLRASWGSVLWPIAALTMIVGTIVGVAQTNVKRMLAYSSIAHGGYLLLALISGNDIAKGAVLFYLLTYAVTNIGAFGVIVLLEDHNRANDKVSDYAGLWNDHPALAALMTVFLLSLGGFPPMAGFIAKWYVFSAAVKAGYTWLAIIGVLTSVVSVFFYLRIVVMMYMTPSGESIARFPSVPKLAGAALVLSALAIFYLGILPSRFIDLAAQSISSIF